MVELRPFQRTFIRHATAPGIDTAALSLPRGNGKSWLAAHLLTRCLTPGNHFTSQVLSTYCAPVQLSKLAYVLDLSGQLWNQREATGS